jgi:hypothetical protein
VGVSLLIDDVPMGASNPIGDLLIFVKGNRHVDYVDNGGCYFCNYEKSQIDSENQNLAHSAQEETPAWQPLNNCHW